MLEILGRIKKRCKEEFFLQGNSGETTDDRRERK
jgi:hypothetical protein